LHTFTSHILIPISCVMGMPTTLFAVQARFLLFLTFSIPAACIPIRPRSIISIDPSPDAWAETLSGIGPLILLVGERATKQLLRAVRGLPDAFSLAAAPLGLLSIVTSLIRLCGYQRLKAIIGYELEARALAAVDMTRVNCGGVHAEVIDGYVSRSTTARPASQAIGVSLLRSKVQQGKSEALAQIRFCEEFEDKKKHYRIADEVAAAQWVLHIVSTTAEEDIFPILRVLYQSVSTEQPLEGRIQHFCNTLRKEKILSANTAILPNEEISYPPKSSEPGFSRGSEASAKRNTIQEQEATEDQIKQLNSVSTGYLKSEKTGLTTITTLLEGGEPSLDEPSPELTFMCTLSSVSEFTTGSQVSRLGSILLGSTSMAAILVIYILALWQGDWETDYGLILAVIGYFGIVFSVISAAVIIHSSCACIPLRTRSSVRPTLWEDGLVISVKNTDSMDTSGSDFTQSSFGPQHFELVCLRELKTGRKVAASLAAGVLVVSFLCHYLGLRSSWWWVSVGELLVCILAAVARSVSKNRQETFKVVEGTKIDKRCTSTGIIQVQKSRKVDKQACGEGRLDARAYSSLLWRPGGRPSTGESIAWHVAGLCFQNQVVSSRILKLAGMHIDILQDNSRHDGSVAVLAHYNGGLLTTEGLVSPATHLCLSFRSGLSDLARPTALLARGIMRQPEWVLDHPNLGVGIPLGNVYILSINSIMDWWTLSEDRNDAEDLQTNLQWCFILINIAFFLELLRLKAEGMDIEDVENAHLRDGCDMETVGNVVAFLKSMFGNEE
jgi:hypothetical protein